MTSKTYERQRARAGAPVAGPTSEQMVSDIRAPPQVAQSIRFNQQQASVTRRSQRLKEQIDKLKSSIPPMPPTVSLGAPTSTSVSSCELPRVPAPPLASLDFSISTEPAFFVPATNTTTTTTTAAAAAHDRKQLRQRQQQQDVSSSSVDTPSLSGFLDCDELSDIVDDSLFEITNAGCLSRSVFSRDSKLVMGGTTSGCNEPEVVREDTGGERTPTKNDLRTIPRQMQGRPLVYSARHSTGVDRALAKPSQVSAIMAHVQSHDYSSTTSVPRQIRSSLTIASGSHDAARLMRPGANQQPDGPAPGARRRYSAGRRAGTKCAACLAHRQVPKSKPIKQAKKRGFTSSLFSLFTSGANNRQEQDHQHEHEHEDLKAMGQQHTCHLQRQRSDEEKLPVFRSATGAGREPANGGSLAATNQAQQRTARDALGPKATKNCAPLPAMRLRDSIKITNQRKLRNSAGAARDKKHQRESNKTGSSGDEEVLLDLSRAGGAKLNNRQSSGAGARSQALVARSSDSSMVSASSSASGSFRQRAISSSSGRQNKCVKFTTPDRVMILLDAGQTVGRDCPSKSAGEKPRKTAQSLSYSNLAGPASQQHQPTPIIKRPGGGGAPVLVPKSSSYSQTEPNKGLDELLARYERDNQLVTAINEKLRLTETIASNLSALDRNEIGNEMAPAQIELNSHQQEEENDDVDEPVEAAVVTDELSISESDLARRPVRVVEASGVFGWRAEDELALAPVVGPAASEDEDDFEGEQARRRRAHEERLEREAASRCECNQRPLNEATNLSASNDAMTLNRIIMRPEDEQISELADINGSSSTQPPSARGSDKISSSIASSGQLAESSPSASTTAGSQEADTEALMRRPLACQSATPQLDQFDRRRAPHPLAPS